MVSQNERRGAEKGGENSNAGWFRDGERWGDDRRRRWRRRRRRSRMDRIRDGNIRGTEQVRCFVGPTKCRQHSRMRVSSGAGGEDKAAKIIQKMFWRFIWTVNTC